MMSHIITNSKLEANLSSINVFSELGCTDSVYSCTSSLTTSHKSVFSLHYSTLIGFILHEKLSETESGEIQPRSGVNSACWLLLTSFKHALTNEKCSWMQIFAQFRITSMQKKNLLNRALLLSRGNIFFTL